MISLKPGVSIKGVSPELAFALPIIASVFTKFDEELVITSVTDGKHGANSLHPKGQALDLRIRTLIGTNIEPIAQALRNALGEEFDVLLEEDHIHIEHDC